MRTDAIFIGIEVDDAVLAEHPELPAHLTQVCPVDIYREAADGAREGGPTRAGEAPAPGRRQGDTRGEGHGKAPGCCEGRIGQGRVGQACRDQAEGGPHDAPGGWQAD